MCSRGGGRRPAPGSGGGARRLCRRRFPNCRGACPCCNTSHQAQAPLILQAPCFSPHDFTPCFHPHASLTRLHPPLIYSVFSMHGRGSPISEGVNCQPAMFLSSRGRAPPRRPFSHTHFLHSHIQHIPCIRYVTTCTPTGHASKEIINGAGGDGQNPARLAAVYLACPDPRLW